jgi:hypothetical protein
MPNPVMARRLTSTAGRGRGGAARLRRQPWRRTVRARKQQMSLSPDWWTGLGTRKVQPASRPGRGGDERWVAFGELARPPPCVSW